VYAEVTEGNVSNPDGKTAAHHRKIGNYYWSISASDTFL
jgi:hypothetical protein